MNTPNPEIQMPQAGRRRGRYSRELTPCCHDMHGVGSLYGDKGITTAGLLAQVLVAKYSDHLLLYRQERTFGRAGVEIPRCVD